MIKHIQKWNEWRKDNGNNPMHKFMVLIGLLHSPTFELYDNMRGTNDRANMLLREIRGGKS